MLQPLFTTGPYGGAMRDVIAILIGAATFVTLLCFWLAWTRAGGWAPVAATVRSCDYGEVEQEQDRAMFGLFANWRWSDSDGSRHTTFDVAFADATGVERRAEVTRYIRRGAIPDAVMMVWYDKADPTRASLIGPLSFIMFGLLAACSVLPLLAMARS